MSDKNEALPVEQLKVDNTESKPLAAQMRRIRDDIATYGYAELGELEALTPAQVEELEMYGFRQVEGSRRIARW